MNLTDKTWKNIFAFSHNWDKGSILVFFWWKIRIRLSCIVSNMAVDAKSQGISSHGIDLVFPEYPNLKTRWVNRYNILNCFVET